MPNRSIANICIDAFAADITNWLEAPNFRDNLEHVQRERTEGTTEWIFQNHIFQNWKHLDVEAETLSEANTHVQRKNILWLHGMCAVFEEDPSS